MTKLQFRDFELYFFLNTPWSYHNYFDLIAFTTHGGWDISRGVWKYGINLAILGCGFEITAQESYEHLIRRLKDGKD